MCHYIYEHKEDQDTYASQLAYAYIRQKHRATVTLLFSLALLRELPLAPTVDRLTDFVNNMQRTNDTPTYAKLVYTTCRLDESYSLKETVHCPTTLRTRLR